jgi:hypothetical protein
MNPAGLRLSLSRQDNEPANVNPAMRCFSFFSLALVVVVASCSSAPPSHVERNEEMVASWPSAVQEKVRAGQIGLGFTTEQVRIALGAPDRKTSRIMAGGTSEIWAYLDHKRKFGIGWGFGSADSSPAVKGGVSANEFRNDERLHVIFEHGVVTAIETAKNE